MKRKPHIAHKCRLILLIHIFVTEQSFENPIAAFEMLQYNTNNSNHEQW